MTQYSFTQIVLVAQQVVSGYFFQDKWAFGKWPQHWSDLGRLSDMTFLEFFPVVVAISVWGSLLANKRIFFHIDNQAVVQIINKKIIQISSDHGIGEEICTRHTPL